MEHIMHGGNTHEIARKYQIPRRDIIDFSANINPFADTRLVTDFIKASLEEIISYPDYNCYSLREAFAHYAATERKYIIPGNGATEVIYLYIQALKPQKALIVAPTFTEYTRALKTTGGIIEYFPLEEKRNFKLPLPDFLERIRGGFDLVIFCNPNNPTSTTIDPAGIKEILDCTAQTGARVMIDESFIEFTKNSSSSALCSQYNNLFVIRSFTKYFAIPGLRLGYGITHDGEIKKKIAETRYPWSINTFAQAAGIVLSRSENRGSIDLLIEERDFLYNSLKELDWLKPFKPEANFLLVKIKNDLTVRELQQLLIEKEILIRDASDFRFLSEKFFRIAVRTREENQILIKELMKIGHKQV